MNNLPDYKNKAINWAAGKQYAIPNADGYMEGYRQAVKDAAMLHENISANCDHEKKAGAGAMGALIRYRDLIRELVESQNMRSRSAKP